MKSKLAIFGVGDFQNINNIDKEKYEVVAFIDNDKLKQGHKIDNIPIISPQQIKDFNVEFVLINSKANKQSMCNDLASLNLPDLKVFNDLASLVDNSYGTQKNNDKKAILDDLLVSNPSKNTGVGLEELLYTPFPRTCFDVERFSYFIATYESAKFFVREMPLANNLITCDNLINFALDCTVVDGLVLEFGVARGHSLRVIASHPSNSTRCVYGFDSFEGLPEDWSHFQKQGRFSLNGNFPENLPENVKLVKGWFDETLPEFCKNNDGPIRFLHIDADLYSSAKTILTNLQDRIVENTVILFDEYFNYPNWQQHEHKAWGEFVDETKVEFKYLGFASQHFSLAVQITKTNK